MTIPNLISLFYQQVKVNCQTERNAEIKYDKDTPKIKKNHFFLFIEAIYSFIRVSQLFLAQRLTVNQDLKLKI